MCILPIKKVGQDISLLSVCLRYFVLPYSSSNLIVGESPGAWAFFILLNSYQRQYKTTLLLQYYYK